MRKLAIIALLSLPSCVSSSDSIRPLRDYEIATAPDRQNGTKSFVGSLMYEGGCLLFSGENGVPRLMPIWPHGTRFEEALVTFHQPAKSDQRVAIGEEIRLDGQPVAWSQLNPAEFEPFHRQCGGLPFFVSSLAPAN